ncbi:MAG: PG binding 4 protein [Candidatus Magasanikbacteria bacterium]|nr:PG binding 4 protein [Candidatus Magasanikbacteria bacterium]
MNDMKQQKGSAWLPIIIVTATLAAILFAAPFVYAYAYRGRVLSGVHLGQVDVSGMTAPQLANALQTFSRKISDQGLPFTFELPDGSFRDFNLPLILKEDSPPLTQIDVDATVMAVLNAGRAETFLASATGGVKALVERPSVKMVFKADSAAMAEALEQYFSAFEDRGENAQIVSVKGGVGLNVSEERSGHSYNYAAAVLETVQNLAVARLEKVPVKLEPFTPTVTAADVEAKLPQARRVIDGGAVTFTYADPQTQVARAWHLQPAELSNWLMVENRGDQFSVTVNPEKARIFFDDIAKSINRDPVNAEFQMEGETVTKILAESTGVAVDVQQMIDNLRRVVEARALGDEVISTIPLVLITVEPSVKLADLNNLGIQEIVGVGVSTFKGSPKNRMKNIGNGVKKLNGVIIKPDEEFSLLSHLRPFTAAAGYLRELVIKGEKIEPDVGGGLCQIGTTIFRAVMNAGLPITERRSHSIVVSYYADLRNKNPGTDATIFDPSPDFKFVNDTGKHLLLTTKIDWETSEVIFTLWGTKDGRKGEYSKPIVLKWIPADKEQKHLPSDAVAPGATICNPAHNGAVATFNYTVTMADGSVAETKYDSNYRPLPPICLHGPGWAASSTPAADGVNPVFQ